MSSTYVIIEGGLGKECAFSALLPKLKERYGKIIVVSPYPQLFFGSPHIAGVHHPEDPFFDRIPRDANVIHREPYKSPYIFGKTHLCYEWARQFEIEWTPADKPQFFGLPQWEMEAVNIRQQHLPREYILVQFAGGQSPYKANEPYVFRPGGQRRAYPLNMAQEFVNAFQKKFPGIGIVNYSMQNEEYFNLQGCITLNTAYWHYPHLLRSSLGFVAVDSSLHHLAAATDTAGVVIWGTTGPDMLGWEGQTNLSNTTRHEGRPLCHPFGDRKNADGTPWVDRDILSTAVPVKDLIDAIGGIIRCRRQACSQQAKKRPAASRPVHQCACGGACDKQTLPEAGSNVVIWGTTGPDMLGGEGQTNLSNTTRHEGRPLCHPFGDRKNADGTPWVDRDILSTAVPVEDLINAIGGIIRCRRQACSQQAKKRPAASRPVHQCACGGACDKQTLPEAGSN